jgi:hypothetical protein
MAEKTTFIKLDRNILQWQWYKDHNTKDVFIHLLLKANIKPHGFMGVTIGRGELATSINSLASETGLSLKNVRTALKHLEATGEVAIKRHSRFSVISILSYDRYQDNRHSSRQSSGNQVALIKESKNGKKPSVYIPSRADISAYVSEEGLRADPDAIFDYYESVGWEINGKPIKDWRAVCRRWKQYEEPKAELSQEDQDAELHRLLDIMEKGGNIYDTSGS